MATTGLDFTTPHLLRDEKEYSAAVEAIDDLLDKNPKAGSEEYQRLDFLSVLVREHEARYHPIGPSSPQELVDFMLAQKGLDRKDLYEVPFINPLEES